MRTILLLLPTLLLCGCEGSAPRPTPTITQLIDVRAERDSVTAKLVCLEGIAGRWERVYEFPATVGKTGIFPKESKKEGDGHTPDGIYTIERAFGYADKIETGLDYKQVTDSDIWIDDPTSPDYNRWVKKPTTAKSFEELRRKDDLYEFAAVIEYNTKKVVPGAGSAIFLHVWGGPKSPTDGCVAVERDAMIKILKWLDVKKKPQIIIGLDELGKSKLSP